ncbi:PIN2/TERF1-interacting telomerase inhibitor 1 [Homalodisca vitripennis]|uniref:PIN2/TERF1-interacting telomerase inhibitor 1 n=1 Tax=Homalodisca vitripennis TaxID=197043 RepID=UPI001EEAF008|nr:PIN2/TERF1-interacting telomerase inhibitor 1 [Homalodisca vitripennis]
MAMLAEKRRREKWCINPRGKAWSDDKTKFGQRLLEKMGWSAGQGLGINNQGPTEIVAVRKKDDNKGLGFKDNGEEWLKTTSDFNDLLDQLGSSMEGEGEQADNVSSLEDRSKKSKARVHYHKFTRGKDLSRYSQKDLASIIGPVVVKSKSGDENDPDYTRNQVNMGSSDKYFKSKKNKREDKLHECNINEPEPILVDNNEQICVKNKKRKKGKDECNTFKEPHEQLSFEIPSKQNRTNDEEYYKDCDEESATIVQDIQVPKKKKKRMQLEAEVEESEICQELLENNETYPTKKDDDLFADNIEEVEDLNNKIVKKKKKKNKEKVNEESSSIENQEKSCDNNETKISYRKAIKTEIILSESVSVVENGCSRDGEETIDKYENATNNEITSKKKKNKLHKNTIITEYDNEETLRTLEKNTKKSKKKKSKSEFGCSELDTSFNIDCSGESEEISSNKEKQRNHKLLLESSDVPEESAKDLKFKKKYKREIIDGTFNTDSENVTIDGDAVISIGSSDKVDGCDKKKKKKKKEHSTC